jgi:hypothetical protein
MSQPLPTVRDLYLPGLLPQVAAILALVALLRAVAPTLSWANTFLLAALAYMIFCRTMRALFAGHHAAGLRAYQERNFADAVAHNLASYEFFTQHPLLDRARHLVFGTASRNPYRTVALCSAGYCEAMRGDHQAAAKYFLRALELPPGCTNAEVGLAMIGSDALAGTRMTPE